MDADDAKVNNGSTKGKITGAATAVVFLLAINGAMPLFGKSPFGTWDPSKITSIAPVAESVVKTPAKAANKTKESVEGR